MRTCDTCDRDALKARIAELTAEVARYQHNADCDQRRITELERDNEGMRAKLLELAGECAECGGSGLVTIRGMCGGVEMDCDDQPCPDCADIREAAR